jgi:hypothetical protein
MRDLPARPAASTPLRARAADAGARAIARRRRAMKITSIKTIKTT